MDIKSWMAEHGYVISRTRFMKSARGSVSALTSSTSITINLALANYFTLTPTADFDLPNPDGMEPGQSGAIWITQPTGGGIAISSFGSDWHAAGGATGQLLSTGADAEDRIDYVVKASDRIDFAISTGMAT